MNLNDTQVLQIVIDALDDKFATDVMILDIRELSVLADYFVIATGSNANQIKAMADGVSEKLHKVGLSQRHIEGYGSASWVLLDFGLVIVHILDTESREFYSIERVWGDAKTIHLPPSKAERPSDDGR